MEETSVTEIPDINLHIFPAENCRNKVLKYYRFIPIFEIKAYKCSLTNTPRTFSAFSKSNFPKFPQTCGSL